MVSNSVYDIIPDLQDTEHSQEYIKVALIAITGQEHYDAVCHLDEVLERTSQADQSTIGDCSPPVMNNNATPMTNKKRKRSTPLGSYEKQRNFICQHVEQTKAKRCTTNRKENSNTYFLSTDGKKERVCKAFFLGILHVSKKTVEYSLKKKEHGVFVGRDNRGKKPSINRTPEGDRHFIREHIQSFPTVSSHYTRKDSNRQYLSSNLSVQKMHQLYEKECQRKSKKPCKINVYRDTFCNEFNLAFHKPKKDQCSTCTIYYEKKQRGEITKEDEEQFQEHQTMKAKSREEKRLDKERAKTDRSFAAVTFDLEAVLPALTVSGETINWLKVKWIRVTKENPGSVFFNNGFDPENFMEAKFQSSSLRGRKKKTGNIKLSPLYESKLQISAAKKADLLSLCKSGVIPTTYHSYYESLPVGKLVKDTLPEPDITEEDLIDNI
ncbi:unnamed protein product [Mytilus coruscus]|uniref:Uncharacterized protein n=1 Tax=Mytilus coruscus TaxID=42192 RepID=A0A6J8E6V6_MYTCO|nr:unnamed protein product [Mytilus coruscus]